jgi:molybdate transport system permease protein
VNKKKGKISFFDIGISGALILYVGIIFLFLIVAVLYVDKESFFSTLKDPYIRSSLKLTVITSIITTIISILIAIPIGYSLSRYRFPGFIIVDSLIDIPIMLPPLVIGIIILVFFRSPFGKAIEASGINFIYTFNGIILSQFLVSASLAVRTMKLTFDGIDKRIENVALTLGCSRWQAFSRVTLPMARNGMIIGAVITWARVVGLFGPLMIVAGAIRGKTEVLATSIYLELSIGRIEVALSIAFIIISVFVLGLILFKKFAAAGDISNRE